MTGFTEFIDITGSNFSRAPLVAGGVRAVYVTGSDGIEETAAQDAAAVAAGMGLILIDQTPGLALFAAGKADAGDIEYLAGTDVSAEDAVISRRALGLSEHTLYVSQDPWAALKAAIANPAGVVYWIANYDDSEVTAEDFITANSDVVSVQFGDPASNPDTLVPGTSVTLAAAQADIDVCLSSWALRFLEGTPAPAPPAPPSTWQEDMMRQLPELSVGATGADVGTIQALCVARLKRKLGATGPAGDGVDDDFGAITEQAVKDVQAAAGFTAAEQDGIVGPQTWPALMDV